ncbi:hypothetical protein CABS01_17203 [Colletotrichum abscissum]|uniref:uncharacterized protein n=1 Tax=Colletotrichum abscissum TaxID=1671311 RepID=UPI0027D58133|nr:uncharacterized protein CABS01_17203 [Colletotrichum abscissum]KAK1485137.1 hypothetical protein CABS01_17203 [Colletotrichum abscissum]
MRGEQTVRAGRLPASSPTTSLGGEGAIGRTKHQEAIAILFGRPIVLAVINALEAWCPSPVAPIDVSGEDDGKLLLHGYIAAGLAAWAAWSAQSAWGRFASWKVYGKPVRATASDSRQVL